jgi:hypothetical protein
MSTGYHTQFQEVAPLRKVGWPLQATDLIVGSARRRTGDFVDTPSSQTRAPKSACNVGWPPHGARRAARIQGRQREGAARPGRGAVLAAHGVTLLRTPNRTPSYNGSCESGLGWHRRRILDVADRGGGIRAWDAEDFETMRLRANDVRRPWGSSGPSFAERFAAREPGR